MKKIAVIMGRKGSSRLPNKNIRPFLDTNLMDVTLNFAVESKIFDRIIVSTDIEQSRINSTGAYEYHQRPSVFANSSATLIQVIQNLIEKNKLSKNDALVLLLPTAPLRIEQDLHHGLTKFTEIQGKHTVMSVGKLNMPVELCWYTNIDGTLKNVLGVRPSNLETRKTSHEEVYFFDENFIVDSVENWSIKGRNLFGASPHYIVTPNDRAMPIDHLHQFEYAEFLYARLRERKRND